MRERVPCWYELSWREGVGIVFRLHKDVLAGNPILVPTDAPIVEDFIADFGFDSFGGIVGEDFGFNRALKFLGRGQRFFRISGLRELRCVFSAKTFVWIFLL